MNYRVREHSRRRLPDLAYVRSVVRLALSDLPQALWLLLVAGLCLLVMSAFTVYTLLFGTTTHHAVVAGHRWERTITVEKHTWVDDTDYYGCPVESRNCSSSWGVVGYHQVVSGYTSSTSCYGSGTSPSCSTTSSPTYRIDPIYGTIYHYQIQEWLDDHRIRSAATGLAPMWPSAVLATDERCGSTTEHYWVEWDGADTTKYEQEVAYAHWAGYATNTSYTIEVDHFGNVRSARRG